MPRKRPKGVLAMGWACIEAAAKGRTEHAPLSEDYPDTVVRRTSFIAGGGHGWRILALETPRATPAPWRIVVITGAPSWAEYWAETLAALPEGAYPLSPPTASSAQGFSMPKFGQVNEPQRKAHKL